MFAAKFSPDQQTSPIDTRSSVKMTPCLQSRPPLTECPQSEFISDDADVLLLSRHDWTSRRHLHTWRRDRAAERIRRRGQLITARNDNDNGNDNVCRPSDDKRRGQ